MEGKNRQRKKVRIGQQDSLFYKVTKQEIEAFASLTKDENKMHTDETFAARQWFQKPVAHGMLPLSLLSAVMGRSLPGDGTILMDIQSEFKKPVFAEDVLKAEVTLVSVREEKIYYIGEFYGTCQNQRDEVVVTMKAHQMMMKNLFEVMEEER